MSVAGLPARSQDMGWLPDLVFRFQFYMVGPGRTVLFNFPPPVETGFLKECWGIVCFHHTKRETGESQRVSVPSACSDPDPCLGLSDQMPGELWTLDLWLNHSLGVTHGEIVIAFD